MNVVVALVVVALIGLVVGALGRLAVPGPDPMPIWTTILLGIAGAIAGAVVGYYLIGESLWFVAAIVVAALLVIAYRRIFQHRGITGPEARRRPSRGFGIRRR